MARITGNFQYHEEKEEEHFSFKAGCLKAINSHSC